MTKQYRAIILGAGRIGALWEGDGNRVKPASHAGAIEKNSATELSGLIDINPEALKCASRLFPTVKTFTSLEAACSELKADIAVIASQPDTHMELLSQCVAKTIPLIVCEKPLSLSLREAAQMREIVRSGSSQLVVNYQRRFFPLFQRAKERIAAGEIGSIQSARINYSNGLFNNASHAIDAICFLLQSRVRQVSGLVSINNNVCPDGDLNINGFCELENGSILFLQSFDHSAYAIHELAIYGKRGALFINRFGYTFEWARAEQSNLFGGLRDLKIGKDKREEEKVSMTAGVIDYAVKFLSGKAAPQSTIEDSMHTIAVLEALRQSALNDGIKLNPQVL